MNTPMRILSVVALSAVASTVLTAKSAAASESATERRDPVTLTFRYDSRDLATREGAEQVYRRLVTAVRRECTIEKRSPVDVRRVDAQCMDELVAGVVAKTNSLQLTGVHQKVMRMDVAARR